MFAWATKRASDDSCLGEANGWRKARKVLQLEGNGGRGERRAGWLPYCVTTSGWDVKLQLLHNGKFWRG